MRKSELILKCFSHHQTLSHKNNISKMLSQVDFYLCVKAFFFFPLMLLQEIAQVRVSVCMLINPKSSRTVCCREECRF